MQISSLIARIYECIEKLEKENIPINKKLDFKKSLFSFKERKISYYLETLAKNLETIRNIIVQAELKGLSKEKLSKIKFFINELENAYLENNISALKDNLKELQKELSSTSISLPRKKDILIKKPKNIPEEIKAEVYADLDELEKCFKAKCYRSAVILCARLLETALHRKLYEITSIDLLEKSPGIGLGKIVAKLRDHNIELPPGIMQQIHLINEIRIMSVHKKKQAFLPTENQAYAIILYTIDILEKLFNRKI